MYKVIKLFKDLQDNGYKYVPGDKFPRDGFEVSDKRLEELSTTSNRRGIILIEKVIEPDETAEPDESIEPIETAEKPRKRGRKSKE